jgi:hypothetical protein
MHMAHTYGVSRRKAHAASILDKRTRLYSKREQTIPDCMLDDRHETETNAKKITTTRLPVAGTGTAGGGWA